MKKMITIVLSLYLSLAYADEVVELSASELKERVSLINNLQNTILMEGSAVADVDALFSHFTDDFTYIHEIYGGTYTKTHLYNNYVKFLKAGRYQNNSPRYAIVTMIPGDKALAVERVETHKGVDSKHLTVFEFEGKQVSKIIEYWK